MKLKTALFAAAASATAIVLPLSAGNAQVAADVGVNAQVNAPVQSTVDAATDAVDSAVDTANTQVGVEARAEATGAEVVAATPADIKAGDTVRDKAGAVVGKIESVDASGAVIATGKSRVQIPVGSFGKNNQGLVIAMSKAELDAAAAAKSPS